MTDNNKYDKMLPDYVYIQFLEVTRKALKGCTMFLFKLKHKQIIILLKFYQ